MPVKSKVANTQLSNEMIQALLQKVDLQSKQIASLMTTQPAAKVMPAKVTPPALSIEAYQGKRGAGLIIKTNGSKWGSMVYPEQWELIKKHAGEINSAFAELPK
jgi:hypothetical protein